MIKVTDTDTMSDNFPPREGGFEKLYIAARKKENRIYSDDQVKQLPRIESSNVHCREWQIRSRSVKRIINYLENKKRPLAILEIGCGNGWLSAKLSTIKDSTIIGTDINKTEIDQAKRLFANKSNVKFKVGDIREIDFKNKKFDIIIFAASIQYFSSFEEIINYNILMLCKGGEIHILDTIFYKANEIEKARLRSLSYYRSIRYEEMAEFYFHHDIDSLNLFDHRLLFNPKALINKLFKKNEPFPWICINGK